MWIILFATELRYSLEEVRMCHLVSQFDCAVVHTYQLTHLALLPLLFLYDLCDNHLVKFYRSHPLTNNEYHPILYL